MSDFPPPLPIGSCFRFASLREPHLWIVATDPAYGSQAMLVSVTTLRRYSDRSCILEPGDHPFVVQQSCISYADARLVESRQLVSFVANNQIEEYDRMSAEMLERVHWGAYQSPELPERIRTFFIDYKADMAEQDESAGP